MFVLFCEDVPLIYAHSSAFSHVVSYSWYLSYACDVACMLQMMELELKKLEETIKNIHEEMFYLRER